MTALLSASRPLVVGILNVTPDSFSDGGLHAGLDPALRHAQRMIADGADLVDVGGESTRPGATAVSEQEEMRRVLPVVEALAQLPCTVSIDTRRPSVANAALRAGARVVNDVSGLRDEMMLRVAVEHDAAVVIMHAPHADPRRAHLHGSYVDVVRDVRDFLARQADRAVAAGVREVAIDPGLGFGKSVRDNVELVLELGLLVALGHPVLVGGSRKRTIGELTGVDEPRQRDPGSIALHLAAVARGARLVRVHDVAGHVQALRVWGAVGPHAQRREVTSEDGPPHPS